MRATVRDEDGLYRKTFPRARYAIAAAEWLPYQGSEAGLMPPVNLAALTPIAGELAFFEPLLPPWPANTSGPRPSTRARSGSGREVVRSVPSPLELTGMSWIMIRAAMLNSCVFEDNVPMGSGELALFLRSRRYALQPADVGLPLSPRRRTAGLRREDVADLAAMSRDYYRRLEQARIAPPSPQILDALARALRLSNDERD